jgi:exodeoxyribonuclease VII small subunit
VTADEPSATFDQLLARLESTIGQSPPPRGSLGDPGGTSPPSGGEEPAGFDEVLARLEGTISRLAEGTAPLDQLVAAHQRATGLMAQAETRLEALKARADRLVLALTE